MLDGWIKINRKITEMKGYFGERFSRVQCWIDLLLLAEWKDGRMFYVRGNKVVVNRGEVGISETELSKRWGMSRNTTRARLQEMVDDGRIEQRKSKTITIIKIVKYETYQASGTSHCANSEQQQNNINCYTTSDYKQTEQQTEQPLRNIKKEKNNIIITNNVRTREKNFQAYISELKQSSIWIEQMQMRFHITNPDELMAWIDRFALDAECRGKEYYNVSDVKQHFNNWLIIQQKIESDANRKNTKIQRRGFEGSVGKAEDYTATF